MYLVLVYLPWLNQVLRYMNSTIVRFGGMAASERVLSTCVDRGERSRPLRRWWSGRGGTAKKLTD
jgi:hypothetical protein